MVVIEDTIIAVLIREFLTFECRIFSTPHLHVFRPLPGAPDGMSSAAYQPDPLTRRRADFTRSMVL